MERGGHCSNHSDIGPRGHGPTFHSAVTPVVSGSADVGNASERKGGAVPDGLHPEDGLPSLRECRRPGTSAQLGPLYGPGLPAKRLPDGSQEVYRGEETVSGEATVEANTGRSTFCGPTEGCPESATAQGKMKRLDFREDVEDHQRENLRTPGPTVWAGV